MRHQLVIGSLVLLTAFVGAASADTLNVVSGTVQGSVLLDGSFNLLGFDVRTPDSHQAIVQDTEGDQVLLSDTFADPGFGNLTLIAQDYPGALGTFELSFLENTVAFISPTELLVEVEGTFLSGSPTPVDESFLGTATFDFVPYSANAVPGTDATLISTSLVSISTAPEPTTVPILLAGAGVLVVLRKRAAARTKDQAAG